MTESSKASAAAQNAARSISRSRFLPIIQKMGGDNPRDAAHALVGKFMTNIYHSNSCPDTNEYASRVIGKVVKRRNNYSEGNSENFSFGMNTGANENSGSSSNSSYGSGSSTSNAGSSNNSNFSSGSGHNSGKGTSWGENRGQGTTQSVNHGYSEAMENALESGDFARILKTGGKENGYQVTGIWFQSGRRFNKSGTNAMLETFNQ